ncbi:MAG: tetratricopeptide repeat protein [Thermoplasmata archaeon]|nr:MAG: tetratricopeptide repeat protein [Thermoplasmata archaeon]
MPSNPDIDKDEGMDVASPKESGKKEQKKWLDWALMHSSSKNYEEVLFFCDKILALDENSIAALNLKGEALDNLGRFEEAIECYNKVLSLNQNIVDLKLGLPKEDKIIDAEYQEISQNQREQISTEGYEKGTALLKEKEFETAIGYIDDAAKSDPQHEMDYKMGALMVLRDSKIHRQEDVGDAELIKELNLDLDYYDKILKDAPYNERAWNNKGTILLRYQKTEEALRCFEKAIQIRYDYVNAWIGKGVVLRKKGDLNEAIISLNKALEFQPENVYAIYAKGCTLLDKNDLEEASLYFDNALRLDPQYPDAWFEKGNALYLKGDFDGALKCFNKTVALDPKDSDAWFQRGNTFFKLKQYTHAIKSYSNAIELNPNDSGALFQKGNTYFNLGSFERALECFDKALNLRKDDGNILNNKAVALRRLGKHKKALECCKKALSIDSENPKFWFNTGRIYEALSNREMAERCFDKASELGLGDA